MFFCAKCGHQLEDGTVFCTFCGTQVQQANSQSAPGARPTFIPLVQTFTPPTDAYGGRSCYYHQGEPAVAQCARCGKLICQDCFDSYGVNDNDEQYGGRTLCYVCTKELVADNVKTLKKQKAKIIVLFVATLIGMLIGASFFTMSPIAGVICMFWFGSFWAWIKNTISIWWNNARSFWGFIGAGIGGLIIAPYITIRKIVECVIYMVKTSKFIECDKSALQEMSDYMEYTLVRNQNKGVDIETLLHQNDQLANNPVAQMARTQTDSQIEARMRCCLATINENGEIIRNFAA